MRKSAVSLVLFAGLSLLVATCAAAAKRPAPRAAAADTTAHAHAADTTAHVEVPLEDLLIRADSLLAARGGSRADSARIYLTWDAPWGMPRAARTRIPRAHDPNAVDTLWLSFLPGRTSEGFLGFSADLYFRAQVGDTLGPWWHLESTGQNHGDLRVEFGPDGSFVLPQPWSAGGTGGVRLYRTPASGRLNINFAVPYQQAVPINPDSVYALCRVLLFHHRDLPGCSQPVCIEWGSAVLGYWLKDDPTVNRGERFVSYASNAAVCGDFLPIVSPSGAEPVPAARPVRARRHAVPGHREGPKTAK